MITVRKQPRWRGIIYFIYLFIFNRYTGLTFASQHKRVLCCLLERSHRSKSVPWLIQSEGACFFPSLSTLFFDLVKHLARAEILPLDLSPFQHNVAWDCYPACPLHVSGHVCNFRQLPNCTNGRGRPHC